MNLYLSQSYLLKHASTAERHAYFTILLLNLGREGNLLIFPLSPSPLTFYTQCSICQSCIQSNFKSFLCKSSFACPEKVSHSLQAIFQNYQEKQSILSSRPTCFLERMLQKLESVQTLVTFWPVFPPLITIYSLALCGTTLKPLPAYGNSLNS